MPFSVSASTASSPGSSPPRCRRATRPSSRWPATPTSTASRGITLEEHHGADNGWSPSPLVMAGLVFGRTKRIWRDARALLAAAARPAAHRRGHRGARPRQRRPPRRHRRHRLPPERVRGARQGLGAPRRAAWTSASTRMLKAWTGEPFEYRGTTVQVTPRPFTQPHPTLHARRHEQGRGPPRGALRAARCSPPANMPELEAYYYEQCAGARHAGLLHDAARAHRDDVTSPRTPSRSWGELGQYFLHEATTYAAWQTARHHSSVHSHATTSTSCAPRASTRCVTPDELRRPADGRRARGAVQPAPARRRHAHRRGVEVAAALRRAGAAHARLSRPGSARAASPRRAPRARGRAGASCGTS